MVVGAGQVEGAASKPRRIYAISEGGVSDRTAWPIWINMPERPDGEYRGYLPPGPRPDLTRGGPDGTWIIGEGTGFPLGMPKPLLVFDRPLRTGSAIDVYLEGRSVQIVSARLKAAYEAIDPEAFEFVAAETRLQSGESGPEYWLCDLVRVIEALDLERSDLPLPDDRGMRWGPHARHVFRAEVTGEAHFFRVPDFSGGWLCDDQAMRALKTHNLKRLDFYERGYVDV